MQTEANQAKSKKGTWHKKIAKNRGSQWRKNLVLGRRDSQLNPSLIKLARLKLGIDQSLIAEKLDVSVSTFGAIERGKQMVKLAKAREIAKILKMSVDKLFKQTASSNSERKKYVAVIQKQTV